MTVTDVVLALDLLGILAFAVNGASTAARKVRLDITGILTLGMVTALGHFLVTVRGSKANQRLFGGGSNSR